MQGITVLAAGSLRIVWPALMAVFEQQGGDPVKTDFAPAGLLLQRIQQGERCDLFASANTSHPQALLNKGVAQSMGIFTRNQLCLSITPELAKQNRSWLELLLDPTLRLATSTPLSDPSGDYTWQLFDRIEASHHREGEALKRRAMPLVGGPETLTVPAGELAASWLLNSGQADMFIGYQSYASLLNATGRVVTLPIAAPWQVQADYAFACCTANARPLAGFLLSAKAQRILQEAGFSR